MTRHLKIMRIWILLSLSAMLVSCQFPANISTGNEMNQTPQNIRSLSPCPGTPNCVCSAYPDTEEFISPIRYEGDAGEAINRMRETIEGMTRAKIVTSTDRYIHAEFTSLIFRFVDDVEILVDPNENVLHVRSASRVGRSDLGANRKRVERIRSLF